MDVYKNDHIVLAENTNEGYTIYSDGQKDYCPMSIPVGKYVAKKLNEDTKHGYKVLDCAKKISRKKGKIL